MTVKCTLSLAGLTPNLKIHYEHPERPANINDCKLCSLKILSLGSNVMKN